MRVRPFFWLLLALSCIGVMIFAITTSTDAPIVMQIHLDQEHPAASGITTLTLHLTDPQGLPVEQAHIVPHASMTNMIMEARQSNVQEIGQGTYVARFQLYMAGPWAITIKTHANGFEPQQQTLLVQVV